MANRRGTSANKTASKTAPQMRTPVTGYGKLLLGGKPGNSGGKKGRSGRTPEEFKQWMQSFANSREAEAGIKGILEMGKAHPLFLGALKHVTEQGYGKPKEDTQHSGEVVVRIVREARAIER